jgi:hypothetical protein
MSTDYKLSETEHRALDDARRLLGGNLVDFLLSGLGETEICHRRAFTARSTSRHSWGVTYRFEMLNESGLAAGREPLVLAALIGLLHEDLPPEGGLVFRECEVLESLGWPDAAESRKFVKQALEKYLSTAYYLVDKTLPRVERILDGYAGFGRLLVSYETNSTPRSVYRIDPERRARIQFPPGFITEIFSYSKRFLGVEFQKLRGIQPVPLRSPARRMRKAESAPEPLTGGPTSRPTP